MMAFLFFFGFHTIRERKEYMSRIGCTLTISFSVFLFLSFFSSSSSLLESDLFVTEEEDSRKSDIRRQK